MDKKEVSINRVVRSIITGFASYGIIFYVLTILVLVLGDYMVTRRMVFLNNTNIRIILSVLFAIFVFVMIRFICRLSTMDVFKKCVVNKESHNRISKKLSLFYIICIALCIFTGLALLNENLKFTREEIEYFKVRYSQDELFSEEHIDLLEENYVSDYNAKKTAMVISTIIVELGLTFGFLSLINYQGKMLDRYNTYTGNESNVLSNSNVEEASKEENTAEEFNHTEQQTNSEEDIDKMAEEIKNLS